METRGVAFPGRAVAILAIALAASACASAGRAGLSVSGRAALNGMIYDCESRPVADAEISVDGEPSARSDVNGRFSLGEMRFGTYALGVSKPGFERTAFTLRYSEATQIIYIKARSAKQLLDAAEKEAEKRNWAQALGFLDRIDAIGDRDPLARYLRAVVRARQGETRESRAILESLLAEDYDEPYVHLFLADLLQYSLTDANAAIGHLEKYLKSRYDPEAEKRLQELRAAEAR
jgi:hypothetical protein